MPPAQVPGSRRRKEQSYRSVISDIFDGSVLSLVQCLTCDRVGAARAQSTCPELSAQGLVPLRWGCALPSPNAPGRAPNHIHTTLRWGRAPVQRVFFFSSQGISILVHQFSSVTQSCPTLCDPMDCSSPGSSIHGISQARTLGNAAEEGRWVSEMGAMQTPLANTRRPQAGPHVHTPGGGTRWWRHCTRCQAAQLGCSAQSQRRAICEPCGPLRLQPQG